MTSIPYIRHINTFDTSYSYTSYAYYVINTFHTSFYFTLHHSTLQLVYTRHLTLQAIHHRIFCYTNTFFCIELYYMIACDMCDMIPRRLQALLSRHAPAADQKTWAAQPPPTPPPDHHHQSYKATPSLPLLQCHYPPACHTLDCRNLGPRSQTD